MFLRHLGQHLAAVLIIMMMLAAPARALDIDDDGEEELPVVKPKARKAASEDRDAQVLKVRSKMYTGTFEDEDSAAPSANSDGPLSGDVLRPKRRAADTTLRTRDRDIEKDGRFAFGVSVGQNISFASSSADFSSFTNSGSFAGSGARGISASRGAGGGGGGGAGGFGGGFGDDILVLDQELGVGFGSGNGESGADSGGDGGGAGYGGGGLGVLGGRGGIRGGEAGGATSTTLGMRAGYLLAREANLSFDGSYNFPDNFNQDGTSSAKPAPSNVFFRGGLGVLPAESFRADFSILYRASMTPDDSTASTGTDTGTTTSSSNRTLTLLSLRLRYALAETVSLFVNGSYSVEGGLLDPTAGAQLRGLIYKKKYTSVNLFASVQASAPLSERAQTQHKLTTLTGVGGPIVRSGDFTLSLTGIVSYNIYNGNGTDDGSGFQFAQSGQSVRAAGDTTTGGLDDGSSGTGTGTSGSSSTSRALYIASSNLNLGYRFAKAWRASTSFALGSVNREDGSAFYNSNYTVLGLGYGTGDFNVSGNFTLVSDPTARTQMSFPNQPYAGIRLDYVFGNRAAFRGAQPHAEK